MEYKTCNCSRTCHYKSDTA